jgi:hypothetical protein
VGAVTAGVSEQAAANVLAATTAKRAIRRGDLFERLLVRQLFVQHAVSD